MNMVRALFRFVVVWKRSISAMGSGFTSQKFTIAPVLVKLPAAPFINMD